MSCRSSQLCGKKGKKKKEKKKGIRATSHFAPTDEWARWSSPAGHGATLRDGVAPHVESHADDGAGQEDGEHHQRADQQVEEGVENGAAGRDGRGASVGVVSFELIYLHNKRDNTKKPY